MEEDKAARSLNIVMSVIGLVLATIVFIAVWIFGGILLNVTDNTRGLGSDELQAIFGEILVPGVGGYAAMAAVRSSLKRANTRFVFFGFSAVVLVFLGVYIRIVGPVASEIGVNVLDMVLAALAMIAAVTGAYINVGDEI